MDCSPDELAHYLLILKDAGVSRARLDGIGEFVFESAEQPFLAETPAPAPEPEPAVFVSAPRAAQSEPDAPSGYAKLFGGQFPSFKKATDQG